MPAFESKYSWGGFSYSVSADVVGKVLEEIEEETGKVTREEFLNRSRNENSPTHSLFEWDDAVAGEKWRLSQARNIINHLQLNIHYVEPTVTPITIRLDERKSVPAYVSITDRTQTSAVETSEYSNIVAAFCEEDKRKTVIRNAMRLLRIFKAQYAIYKEFSEIIDAISKLEERVAEE